MAKTEDRRCRLAETGVTIQAWFVVTVVGYANQIQKNINNFVMEIFVQT